MLVARETIWLTREQRASSTPSSHPGSAALGDRQVEAEARKIAYRLDPAGFLARARNAERDRRVTLRPAPDTMTRLSALLPAAKGVAAYAALVKAAATARAGGDQRGRGQVMADTLVERVTGQATADGVPAVAINLVMTDHTLAQHRPPHRAHRGTPTSNTASAGDTGSADHAAAAGGAGEPGHLVGYGPIPAGLARDLAHGSEHTKVWVRRLYTDPCTGHLDAMDTRARPFPGNPAGDHHPRPALPHPVVRCPDPARRPRQIPRRRRRNQLQNGQGLCEACNYAKQAPGWSVHPDRVAAANR